MKRYCWLDSIKAEDIWHGFGRYMWKCGIFTHLRNRSLPYVHDSIYPSHTCGFKLENKTVMIVGVCEFAGCEMFRVIVLTMI